MAKKERITKAKSKQKKTRTRSRKNKPKGNLIHLQNKIDQKMAKDQMLKEKLLKKSKADASERMAKEKEMAKQERENSKENPAKEINIPEETKFEELEYDFKKVNLSEKTVEAMDKMGFSKMTDIQAKSIPLALSGNHLIAAAKTGSGKTLAFLIPAIETLDRIRFRQKQGTGVLIITPTRELALQIYGVLKELCESHKSRNFGVLMGGNNRSVEAKRLAGNVSILVSTPGRLLDHLKNTKNFKFDELNMLIIDEADRILDQGFEMEMVQILKILPKGRQTLLFSATQTKKTRDLIKLSFREPPLLVSSGQDEDYSTREGLTQGYVEVQSDEKFRLLYSFLKRNRRKKVIVFFSTCNATRFYSDLFNYIDIPVAMLHGDLRQSKRTSTFFEFINSENGIMLCTDVAARGLDIPSVDWIIQYDPPDNPKSYIHRVGRTARGISGKGKALIFLLKEELGYLEILDELKVPVKKYNFPLQKMANVQSQLEKIIDKNFYLAKVARAAYKSYLRSYAMYANKRVFNVHNLDIMKVAKSFGFDIPPKVDLNISLGGKKSRKRLFSGNNSSNAQKSYRQFSR